jgi:hypothetical protein
VILNASHVDVDVILPERAVEGRWHVEINTAAEDGAGHATCQVGTPFKAAARSFVLLRGTTPAVSPDHPEHRRATSATGMTSKRG